MTKLLRLPALVLFLTTAACQTAATATTSTTSSSQVAPDDVTTDIVCDVSTLGMTTCNTSAPEAVLVCQAPANAPLNFDMAEGWIGTWVIAQQCDHICQPGGGGAVCTSCTPGAFVCTVGVRSVCSAQGTWVPGGSCGPTCKCGGIYPHCFVCK